MYQIALCFDNLLGFTWCCGVHVPIRIIDDTFYFFEGFSICHKVILIYVYPYTEHRHRPQASENHIHTTRRSPARLVVLLLPGSGPFGGLWSRAQRHVLVVGLFRQTFPYLSPRGDLFACNAFVYVNNVFIAACTFPPVEDI